MITSVTITYHIKRHFFYLIFLMVFASIAIKCLFIACIVKYLSIFITLPIPACARALHDNIY